LRATLLFLAWMLAFTVTASSITALRANLEQPLELLATLVSYIVLPAFSSWRQP